MTEEKKKPDEEEKKPETEEKEPEKTEEKAPDDKQADENGEGAEAPGEEPEAEEKPEGEAPEEEQKTLWNDKYTKSQTDELLAEKADADDVIAITTKTTVNHTLGITATTKTCKEIYNVVDTTLTFNIQNPEGFANGVELLAAGELAAPPTDLLDRANYHTR